MKRIIILTLFLSGFFWASNGWGTHLVDSIRVTVSSGSHTISTTSFPNGVWFILSTGARETVKTSPPFPTVTPGQVVSRTYNLLANPDSVVGANFDISMDGVPHGGGNFFTGSSWLVHLNQFGDLIGHSPNDADIKYELILKQDPSTIPLLRPPGIGLLILLLAATAVYYFYRRRKTTG